MYVIVRHGNTFAATEKPRRIGSRTDLPLTARGLAQADALGVHFSGQGLAFAQALVSPMLRTRQTAEAILARQPAPLTSQYADFLREIDHGPDENRDEEAVIARIGAAALSEWDSHALPPPGWIVDAPARMAAWQDLYSAKAAAGPVLIVTSNGAARFALLADPELQQQAKGLPTLKLPTGGFGIIERDQGGALRIAQWGSRP